MPLIVLSKILSSYWYFHPSIQVEYFIAALHRWLSQSTSHYRIAVILKFYLKIIGLDCCRDSDSVSDNDDDSFGKNWELIYFCSHIRTLLCGLFAVVLAMVVLTRVRPMPVVLLFVYLLQHMPIVSSLYRIFTQPAHTYTPHKITFLVQKICTARYQYRYRYSCGR